MEQKIQTSFIIVNYRSQKHLKKCIASIREMSENFDYEIIVINNDQDNLNDSLAGNNISILEVGKNKGYGSSCNLGAQKARGKYLCFLNPDSLLLSKNTADIISKFEENDRIGIVGPRLINEKNETQWWCTGAEANLWDLIGNNFGLIRSKKIWESEEKMKVAWVSGACLFIKKNIFEKVSGFDENFFMYYEDVDLCKRVRALGYKIIYFPQVTVKHLGSGSFKDRKKQKEYFYSSQDYYFRKHFGRISEKVIKFLRMFHSSSQ